MRLHHQFNSLPMNRPLKSPSPDIKSKNAIVPTTSPQNFRKTYSQYTPPNKIKRQSYIECSTLPVQCTEKGSEMIEKMFESTRKSNQHQREEYESKAEEQTQAKGRYNFQLPKDLLQSFNTGYAQEQDIELLPTGKKPTHIPTCYKNPSPQHLVSLLNQKDTIISQLKQMINLMTQNGKHLKNSQRTIRQEQFERMKGEVRILTIENQKLAEIIDRLNDKIQRNTKEERVSQSNRPKSYSQQFQRQSLQKLHQTISSLQHQILDLQQQLRSKQSHYQKQIDELINSHKSLAVECKMFENEKERFSRENERLINLLRLKEKEKETGFGGYGYVGGGSNKRREEQEQLHNNIRKGNNSTNNSSLQQQSTMQPLLPKAQALQPHQQKQPRLSLSLIKSQYQQNLLQYKQNIHHQLTVFIQTIKSTLQDLSDKLAIYEERILLLQQTLRKGRDSHLTSLQQGSEEEEIKKSAIYIQEAPSSQRVKTESRSRQALSMILEESRRDQSRLQIELSRLRKQLEFYKQTLKIKAKQDHSLGQSLEGQQSMQKQAQKRDEKRRQTQSNQDFVEQLGSYRVRIKELEDLVDQLREDSEDRIKELQQKERELEYKQRELQQMKMTVEDKERQLLEIRMMAQINLPKSSQSLAGHNQSKIKEQSPLKLPLPISQQQHTAQLITSLQQQLLQTQSHLNKKTTQHQHLEQTLFNIQTSLKARQQQLLQQIQNLQHVINQTEKAFNSSKRQFQVERGEYLVKIAEIETRVGELQGELGKQRKERDLERVRSGEVISCEIKQLKEGLERLERERAEEVERKDQEVKQLKRKIGQLQHKSVAVQQEISRSDINKTRLQSTITNLQQQRTSLLQQLSQLSQQSKTLKTQHSHLQQQHTRLQQQYNRLQQQHSLVQSRLVQLSLKWQSLSKHRHQLTPQIYLHQLQSYMQQLSQRISALDEENCKYMEENGKYREQLQRALMTVEEQRNHLLQGNEHKIRLEQQLSQMQRTVELYQKELRDRALVYENLVAQINLIRQQPSLTTTIKQSTTTNTSTYSITNTTKQPSTTKTRIHSIIQHQKQKLSQLLTLIDQLNTQVQ